MNRISASPHQAVCYKFASVYFEASVSFEFLSAAVPEKGSLMTEHSLSGQATASSFDDIPATALARGATDQSTNTKLSSISILGLPFTNGTMSDFIRAIDKLIAEKKSFHQIATANVNFVVTAMKDPLLRDILRTCSIVTADGMPLVWVSRFFGAKLKERVSGSDLVPRLAELAAARGYRIFILGGETYSSTKAAERLKEMYPGLQIVGCYAPPVEHEFEMDHAHIIAQIHKAKTDILMVAFGNPKQEKWIAMHRNVLKVSVAIGIGGSLNFIAGSTKRAPMIMQKLGIEWIHRVMDEPQRLFKRYISDGAQFARYLAVHVVSHLQQRRAIQSRPGAYEVHLRENVTVMQVKGSLDGKAVERLNFEIQEAVSERRSMIINMLYTSRISSDALGSMISGRSQLKALGCDLWIAAVPRHLDRFFDRLQVQHLFPRAITAADAVARIVAVRSLGVQTCEVPLRNLLTRLSEIEDQIVTPAHFNY